MQLNRIDLNLLVVLDAIQREGGITRAAEKLSLSQPAISHALARLREMFGDPLFVREGRSMTPTPLARRLEQPLRQMLRGLETTLNELDRFDPATAERRFTIAVRDVFEAMLLPPLMQTMARVAPGVSIVTVRSNRRDIESELRTGTLDAALDMLLPLPEPVRRRSVFQDHLVVAARRDHSVVGKTLSLEAYLQQGHVHASWSRGGRGLEDMELERLGLRRNIRLHCQHYFAACRVVSQTDLLLTMPRVYAAAANAAFDNRILPFPVLTPPLDGYLYWHVDMDRDAANQWLRNLLVETLTTASVGG